ncbi:MAG: hypothetical protein U0556_07730 [Dehalococcoidia bacterium]
MTEREYARPRALTGNDPIEMTTGSVLKYGRVSAAIEKLRLWSTWRSRPKWT